MIRFDADTGLVSLDSLVAEVTLFAHGWDRKGERRPERQASTVYDYQVYEFERGFQLVNSINDGRQHVIGTWKQKTTAISKLEDHVRDKINAGYWVFSTRGAPGSIRRAPHDPSMPDTVRKIREAYM